MPHYRIHIPNRKYLYFEAEQGENVKDKACEISEKFIEKEKIEPIPSLLCQQVDEKTKKSFKSAQTFILKFKTIRATLSNGTILMEQFYMTTYR